MRLEIIANGGHRGWKYAPLRYATLEAVTRQRADIKGIVSDQFKKCFANRVGPGPLIRRL